MREFWQFLSQLRLLSKNQDILFSNNLSFRITLSDEFLSSRIISTIPSFWLWETSFPSRFPLMALINSYYFLGFWKCILSGWFCTDLRVWNIQWSVSFYYFLNYFSFDIEFVVIDSIESTILYQQYLLTSERINCTARVWKWHDKFWITFFLTRSLTNILT